MKLTKLEAIALDHINNSMSDLSAESGVEMALEGDSEVEGQMNEADVESVAGMCEISVNQAKGVLGSLTKKGFADCWDHEVDGKTVYMIEATAKGLIAWSEMDTEVADEEPEQAKEEPKKESKKEIAVRIFNEMKDAKRKEVVERFQKEAGLTKAGASTYYQNIKNHK